MTRVPTSALFTSDDLAAYPGGPSSLSPVQFALLRELVEGELLDALPDASVSTWPASARAVALEVAARAWRNREGLSSWTVDDVTKRREVSAERLGIYLTDDEVARLSGSSVRLSGAFTIRPGRAS